MLTFTAYGEPHTKGSVKAFHARRGDGSLVTRPGAKVLIDGKWVHEPVIVKTDDTGKDGKYAMASLGEAALAARAQADCPLWASGVALHLTLRFYSERPKSHYGTGRNATTVKDRAPAHPATRPDIDKLERHVLDALKGALYSDDSQIVQVFKVQAYGNPARTEIEIAPMDQQTVGTVVPDDQLALAA